MLRFGSRITLISNLCKSLNEHIVAFLSVHEYFTCMCKHACTPWTHWSYLWIHVCVGYDSRLFCECFSKVSVQVCIIHIPVSVNIYTLSLSVFTFPLRENEIVCTCEFTCVCSSLWLCACIIRVDCMYELPCDFKLQVQVHNLPRRVKINCPPQRKNDWKRDIVLAEYKPSAPLTCSRVHPLLFSALYNLVLPGLLEEFSLLVPSSGLWKIHIQLLQRLNPTKDFARQEGAAVLQYTPVSEWSLNTGGRLSQTFQLEFFDRAQLSNRGAMNCFIQWGKRFLIFAFPLLNLYKDLYDFKNHLHTLSYVILCDLIKLFQFWVSVSIYVLQNCNNNNHRPNQAQMLVRMQRI